MPSRSVEQVLRDTKIYQLIRPKLVLAREGISTRTAIAIMQSEKTGYVVITDAKSKVSGLFTEREVLMKVLMPGAKMDVPVSHYMRTDIPTLSKSSSLQEALNTMEKYAVRHLPLTDEYGELSGILSIRSIVNYLAELFPTEVFNLPPKPQVFPTVEGG